MRVEKQLGKIQSLKIGLGGYQDAMFGVSITLGGQAWGVGDFKGFWSPAQMERSDHAKWSETDRQQQIYEAFEWLDQLLHDAGKQTADQLVGVPIEATFNDNTLVSWRVLKEVL